MFVFYEFKQEEIDLGALKQRRKEEISKQRGWYIFEGIVFLLSGLLAAFCLLRQRLASIFWSVFCWC